MLRRVEAPGPAGARPAGVVVFPGVDGFDDPATAAAVRAAVERGLLVVAAEPANLRSAGTGTAPGDTALARAGARVIYGRGNETARWAAAFCAVRAGRRPLTLPYGSGPDQVGDLWVPPGGPGPHPVAVLLHGGFWYHAWERDLMDGLAADLAARRGTAAWNVEYRRTGAGGGWPQSGADVAAAVDHLVVLAGAHGLDPRRITLVGHSAGGQLALWAAAGRPEAGVRPHRVVGVAALTDLAAAAAAGVGGRSVERFLAGAADPDAARGEASPVERLPLGVPVVLVHCADDPVVPVAQSRSFAAAARRAGDAVELVELPTGGHFEVLDPASPAWAAVAARLLVA